jgi:signal transduction histidine kinase
LETQHMQTTETSVAGNDLLVLTRESPSRTQKLLAFVVVPGILAVVFIISRPLAGVQLRTIDAFVPFYVTAILLNNLITSVLLFAQFSILRTRALLVIANGYLFAGLMIIPYTLSFPGVFEPGQSLIGGLQSTPWLYILRHCGFAMFVVAFALLRDFDVSTPYRHSVRQSIFPSFAATVAVVLAAAFVCIAGDTLLPTIINDPSHFDATWIYYAGGPIASLYVLALILLWFRRHTVLGLWLMVVSCVHLAGVPLSFFPPPIRFSVGWYTVVIINLIANSLVLVVLLVGISKLYARVLLAVRAHHRERDARLVTGDAVSAMIAHEVKQPLSAMITRAETTLRRLNRSIPDLDKAKEEIKQIAADGYRAGVVIDSIRANFKKDARVRTLVDVNGLIAETMDLVRSDLQKHRILHRSFEPRVELPQVAADRSQLQQVLLNLITNAIDSMGAEDGARILSVTSEFHDNSEIVVSVADTGSGINSQDRERVFNPLFTTKSSGMGMGLSICRSIIEAHDGRIWVESNSPKGAVFQFALSLEIFNTRI